MKLQIKFTFFVFLLCVSNLFGQKELIASFGSDPYECWIIYQYYLFSDGSFEYLGDYAIYGSGKYFIDNDTIHLTFSGEYQPRNTIRREPIDSNEIQLEIRHRFGQKPMKYQSLVVQKESQVVDTIKCDSVGIFHLGGIKEMQDLKEIGVKAVRFLYYDNKTYKKLDPPKLQGTLFHLGLRINKPRRGTKFIIEAIHHPTLVIFGGLQKKIVITNRETSRWKVRQASYISGNYAVKIKK